MGLKKCLYNIMMNISLMNVLMKNMMNFMKMNEGHLACNMIYGLDVMLLVVMKCYKTVEGRKMEKGEGVS